MVLFKKRITKALIRLRGCAGWSAPVLFTNLRRQVFSCQGPFVNTCIYTAQEKLSMNLYIVATLDESKTFYLMNKLVWES